MLLTVIPAGALSLFPANTQLVAVTLPKYRELLRKLKANGSVEESSSAFQQAKERVLLRLQQRRERARLDPTGAFRRMRDRALQARRSLRELKNEHKERLRQYYYEAVRGASSTGLASPGRTSVGSGALAGGDGSGGSGSSSAELAAQPSGASATAAAVAGADEAGAGELDPEAVQRTLGPNGLFRALVVAGVGTVCKAFLHGASRTSIQGEEIMRAALERPAGQALITVSNHVGAIDDPLITSAVVPTEYLFRPEALRWTMCATDRCFKSKLLAPFFKAAKVLPVERGAGLAQYGMRVAQSRLAAGDWVHIFPEGTRSRTGKMGPVRRGVGWLVAGCDTPPLVVPFVHSGMEKVIPKGAKLPQTGQQVRVLVGEPVPVEDLLAQAGREGWLEGKLHMAIADRVGAALYALKAQLERLPLHVVLPEREAAWESISEESLLPLIEEEMDSMRHRWRDSWQRSGLPSLTHRVQQALRQQAAAYAAAGSGEGGEECEGGLFDFGGLFGVGSSGGSGSSTVEELGGVLQEGGAPSSPPDDARAPLGLRGAGGGSAAQQGAGDGPAGLVRRQGAVQRALCGQQGVLRMLRGSGRPVGVLAPAPGGPHPAAHDLMGSSADLSMEPSVLSMGSMATGASSARLRRLMSAAADYSAERVQHMRQLVGGRPLAPAPC